MSEPVVFISHFAVKEGALDELKRMSGGAVEGIREGKPRTILFLSYLDEQGGRISFLHAFPDADAMDQHFEGADDRAAAKFGVPLIVEPEFNAGFLRLAPA